MASLVSTTVNGDLKVTGSSNLFFEGSASSNTYEPGTRIYGAGITLTGGAYTSVFEYTVPGGLAGNFRFFVKGTTGNVVIPTQVDVLLNHSKDITIKSQTGNYTPLHVKVLTNNNEDCLVQLKADTSGNANVTVYIDVIAFGDGSVSFSSFGSYTGTSLEHKCNFGFAFSTINNTVASTFVMDGSNSGGRLGIGTNVVNADVEVSKSSTTNGPVIRLANRNDSISAGGTHGAIEFFSGDNSNPADQVVSSIKSIHVATSPNYGELAFSTGSNSEAVRINLSGNVGIGTTDPDYLLDIDGHMRIRGQDTRWTNSTVYLRADTPFYFLAHSSGNAQRAHFKSIQVSTSYSGTPPDNGILFSTDTTVTRTASYTLTTNAKEFKIASASGDGVLKVYGAGGSDDGRVELLNQSGGTAEGFRIRYDNDVGDTYFDNMWAGGSDANPAIRFRTKTAGTAVSAMTISHGGNVGVSLTNPTYKFHVSANSTTLAMFDGGNQNNWVAINSDNGKSAGIKYLNAGTAKWFVGHYNGAPDGFSVYDAGDAEVQLYVEEGGNVGIGTTQPSQKLDVNGNTELNGSVNIVGGGWLSFDGEQGLRKSGSWLYLADGGFTSGLYTRIKIRTDGYDISPYQDTANVTSATTLGISSKRWYNVYSQAGNFSGTVTATTFSGTLSGTADKSNMVTGSAFATTGSPGSVLEYQQASGQTDTKLAPTTDWYNTIRMGHGNPYSYYSNTIAVQMTGTGAGQIRTQLISNNNAQGWRTVWDNVNDGSGSGLDADLLDGLDYTSFAYRASGGTGYYIASSWLQFSGTYGLYWNTGVGAGWHIYPASTDSMRWRAAGAGVRSNLRLDVGASNYGNLCASTTMGYGLRRAGVTLSTDSDWDLLINTDGNVGIGTTNPSTLLEVGGDADEAALIGKARIGMMGYAGYAAFGHRALGSVVGKYAVLQDANGGSYFNAATGQTVSFRIGNSDQMVLSSGQLKFPDSKKIIMGTGNDMEIYHDGSNSYIKEASTGDIILDTNSNIRFKSSTEHLLNAAANGAVELYYNNTKTFETKANGARLTQSTGYLFGGDNEILAGQDSGGYYFATGAGQNVNKPVFIGDNASYIKMKAGDAERFRVTTTGATLTGNLIASGTLDVNGSGQQMASFGNTSARCGIEVKSSQWCEVFFTNSTYANSARIGMAYDSSHSSSTQNGDWYVYQPNVARMDIIVRRTGNVILCGAGGASAGKVGIGTTNPSASLHVGNSTTSTEPLRLQKSDNNVGDHVTFYLGSTRMGEIGCHETTWLRINQETAKNIYTPRMIRADNGFQTDGITVITGTGVHAGSGAQLTSLNGSNIGSGTVPAARLGSGSSITTKFLRGDNTWQTVSSGSNPNNATITLSAGTNLSGGGNFTTNQSSNETITFNMATGGFGAGTYGSTSDSSKIDQITLDAYGRVTNITTGGTGDITAVNVGGALSGGGSSGSVTVSLGNAGAGAGTYGDTSNSIKIDTITLDQYGRVTAVATGATGSGSMSSWNWGISGSTTSISQGETVRILAGTNVTVSRSGNDVTINASGGGSTPNNKTITLSAGTGLSNGGAFTTNQSFNETITFNVDGTVCRGIDAPSGSATPSSGEFDFLQSGGITVAASGNNVTFSSSSASDYRLKKNVTDFNSESWTKVKSVSCRKFDFDAEKFAQAMQDDYTIPRPASYGGRIGFIAHELEALGIDGAVEGEKDGVDENGVPIYQKVSYTTLVPVLWGALNEAIRKIEILESKVQALEDSS